LRSERKAARGILKFGVVIMMREIGAPLRVFGTHWGRFRAAYKI
jgi:hypothetical protein